MRLTNLFHIALVLSLVLASLLMTTVSAFAAVPTANFVGYGTLSGSRTIGVGETINFEDKSIWNPTSWLWTFGDSTTSTVRNPVHTYAAVGTYTVTLVATNSQGSSTMLARTNYITVLTSMSHTVDLSLVTSNSTVAVGQLFAVTIAVASMGQAISGIDAFISFDPTVLQVDSIVSAPGNLLTTELWHAFDNDAGWVSYADGKMSAPLPSTPFNLAVVFFNAISSAGSSPITFVNDDVIGQTMITLNGIAETGVLSSTSITAISYLPNGTLTGVVSVQGNAYHRAIGPLRISFFAAGTTDADLRSSTGCLFEFTVELMPYVGDKWIFSLPSIPPANYDVLFSMDRILSGVRRGLTVYPGANNIDLGILVTGNVNNDNIINALDFSILAGSYLKGTGQPWFDSRADLNYSGYVEMLDFSLLAANYMKRSPIPIP
jgi:PKD repeat protein